MKVLIIGSDKVYAIENYYYRYIKEAGHEVVLFPSQSIFYDYYQNNILNKVSFRLGFSGIIKQINRLFIEAINKNKPDIIWVFKGMELYTESLLYAKKRNIILINYNPDNPFIFSGSGSGNKFILEAIPLYDLHFTYNLKIEHQLIEEYKVKTAYLPFGFDVSKELFEECKEQKERIKACFLGNPDKQRAAFINSLAKKGIKIDVYGNNWQKFVKHKFITIFPPIYGNELWKVLRRYRLQINIMRVHNVDSHNMRSFEVPGIGGIMVAPDTTEHRNFFCDKKEAYFYSDSTSCTTIINELLDLSTQHSVQIRENARNRSILSGYSYKDRAKFAIETIQQMYG